MGRGAECEASCEEVDVMSSQPTGWQTPKTNWQSADVPLPSDFNRIEGDIQAIEDGLRTLDPSQAPSGNSGSLRQFLDWFANRLKAIAGAANWYDAPATTLAATKSHMDATSGIHGATSSATANRLVIRDASGRAQFAVPSASGDAATKGYVDALLGAPMAAGTNFIVQVTDLNDIASSSQTYPNWQESIRNLDSSANNVAVRILLPGTVRCALEHRARSSDLTAYVRVLKNGSVVREWNTNSTTFVARSVDVDVSPGDVITFQQRFSGNAVIGSSWRNLRVMTAAPTLGIQRIL